MQTDVAAVAPAVGEAMTVPAVARCDGDEQDHRDDGGSGIMANGLRGGYKRAKTRMKLGARWPCFLLSAAFLSVLLLFPQTLPALALASLGVEHDPVASPPSAERAGAFGFFDRDGRWGSVPPRGSGGQGVERLRRARPRSAGRGPLNTCGGGPRGGLDRGDRFDSSPFGILPGLTACFLLPAQFLPYLLETFVLAGWTNSPVRGRTNTRLNSVATSLPW